MIALAGGHAIETQPEQQLMEDALRAMTKEQIITAYLALLAKYRQTKTVRLTRKGTNDEERFERLWTALMREITEHPYEEWVKECQKVTP